MHFFQEALVRAVFGPQFEEIKKMGVIDRWLDEKYEEGINQGARQLVLRLVLDKFGRVPAEIEQRVEHADAEWCQQLNLLIAKAQSLDELKLSEPGPTELVGFRLGTVTT